MSGLLLRNCIRVLLDTPGATILGVTENAGRRGVPERCVANCQNPVVRQSWDVIEGWDGKQYAAYAAFLQTKMDDLLLSTTMQNIFGQPQTTFWLDRGKIVIANLNRAKIGDRNAFMLGSFLLARAKLPVYINDLGFFKSDHLAGLFSQGGYTAAVRFLGELTPNLRQAVLDPTTEKYVFQTNRPDAEELAFYVGIDNPPEPHGAEPRPDRIPHCSGYYLSRRTRARGIGYRPLGGLPKAAMRATAAPSRPR